MDSLTEFYDTQLVPLDAELEKQASDMEKQAAEENFCGRIMARGFADELNKIAEGILPMPKGQTIKAKDPALAIGKPAAPGGNWGISSRGGRGGPPKLPGNSATAGTAVGTTTTRGAGGKTQIKAKPVTQ